jgi:hypothetical protein
VLAVGLWSTNATTFSCSSMLAVGLCCPYGTMFSCSSMLAVGLCFPYATMFSSSSMLAQRNDVFLFPHPSSRALLYQCNNVFLFLRASSRALLYQCKMNNNSSDRFSNHYATASPFTIIQHWQPCGHELWYADIFSLPIECYYNIVSFVFNGVPNQGFQLWLL